MNPKPYALAGLLAIAAAVLVLPLIPLGFGLVFLCPSESAPVPEFV